MIQIAFRHNRFANYSTEISSDRNFTARKILLNLQLRKIRRIIQKKLQEIPKKSKNSSEIRKTKPIFLRKFT